MVPVAQGGLWVCFALGKGSGTSPCALEKPLIPLDSFAEVGYKLAVLLCSGNTPMGCPPQGSQGPFGAFGFPFWRALSSVVVRLFHAHYILLVKIVPYRLIFILKPQRAGRLSSPEGIDQYPWIRAGVLQYNFNQHQVSFGFLNLHLTLSNLKTLG